MNPILERISENLDANELNFKFEEDLDFILFTMCGDFIDIKILIRIQVENIVVVTAILPVNIPESSYPRVLDAINEINKEALISTLYLDKEEKRVFAQSFMMVTDIEDFDDEIFTSVLSSAISRINSYTKDIIKIALSDGDETFTQLMLRKQITEALNDDKNIN